MDEGFEVLTRRDQEELQEFNGGSLKGYVLTNFRTLCETFGTPTYGPFDAADKVTCEWKIVTGEGLLVTIYDWKEGETPMGDYEWHIGGHSFENVEWVGRMLNRQTRRWK
jgi:hypothetical protein